MAAFNVVRFRVIPGGEQQFIEAHERQGRAQEARKRQARRGQAAALAVAAPSRSRSSA